MNRRNFVKNTGLAAVGGAAASCRAGSSSENAGGPKRILITSAEHPVAQSLADALSADHDVLLTGREAIETVHTFTQSDLGHEEPTNDLVRGVGAIVHVAEPLPTDGLHAQIDYLTRCTYNLLWAATQEGVRRAVFLSSLELMTAYDEDFLVEERWRPRPALSSPALPKYLGEFTCREFARVCKMNIVVLRMGKVTVPGEAVTPTSITHEDAAQAVSLALKSEVEDDAQALGRWSLFHVSSGSDARFSSQRAQGKLGYEPRGGAA